MNSGKLIVITGPSGVGKGTLIQKLIWSHQDQLHLSISVTTRSPRIYEREGLHYYFVAVDIFHEMISDNHFLEWAQYAGNYYGTPRMPVETRLKQGQNILLEIEVIGARKVKESFKDALTVFILPPSMDELERRLKDRGTESLEVISSRLERAKVEIAASKEFDYCILNDDCEIAIERLEKIIFPH